eukprot:m.340458 g.340458  ORF g.340458 m.340458 type:complete len:191 (+) comp19318_c0_seq1:126-698(+)
MLFVKKEVAGENYKQFALLILLRLFSLVSVQATTTEEPTLSTTTRTRTVQDEGFEVACIRKHCPLELRICTESIECSSIWDAAVAGREPSVTASNQNWKFIGQCFISHCPAIATEDNSGSEKKDHALPKPTGISVGAAALIAIVILLLVGGLAYIFYRFGYQRVGSEDFRLSSASGTTLNQSLIDETIEE